jgi:hypothetical protein
MTKRGVAVGALTIFVVLVGLLTIFALVDRQATPADAEEDVYGSQLATLAGAWEHGKQARETMLAKNIEPNALRCTLTYRATEASEIGDEEFQERGEEFFRYGCLNIRKLQ